MGWDERERDGEGGLMGVSGLIGERMGRPEVDRSTEKAVVYWWVGLEGVIGDSICMGVEGLGGGPGMGKGGLVVIGGWDQLLGLQLEVWGRWVSAGGREVGWMEGQGDEKGRSG